MVRYLGADVGGTNVRVGGMDESGAVVFQRRVPTMENVSGGVDLIRKLDILLRSVPGWEDAEAVGIGVPGAVSPATGCVTVADNLTLLNGLPLAQTLEKSLGKPVRLENDARVAALAEAIDGAGKGKETVCYMTISTGLGGATVHRGKLYRGSTNMGSYLCRMILDGGQNCENLLSGTSLQRRLSKKLGRPVASSAEVFTLAAAGNEDAAALRETFIRNLSELFLNLAITFNPDIIVAGGGVMQSAESFWEEATARFREIAHPQLEGILFARALHEEPGLLGSCLLATQEKEQNALQQNPPH